MSKAVKALLITTVFMMAAALYLFRDMYPMWGMRYEEKSIILDDGRAFELSQKKVAFRDASGNILWRSEDGFLVQDMLLCDIDSDRRDELVLLLWKRGRYGKSRPFWVKENDSAYSQHIFIYTLTDRPGEYLKSVWGASDIGANVKRFRLLGDGNDEKAAASHPIILTEEVGGRCSLWHWQSFGLKNIDNEVSFIAFGDNLIHRDIYEYGFACKRGDFSFLYRDMADEIKSADIAAVQQESILVSDNRAWGGYPSFGTPLQVGEAVTDAGFDVISCAGNHALDRGMTGINDTWRLYEGAGLVCLGIQPAADTQSRPYRILSKKGIRFALFDYTYGTGDNDVSEKYPYAVHYLPDDPAEEKAVLDDLQDARQNADVTVVFVHWGQEGEYRSNAKQRRLAELFAKGGADVVIGTHPHVIQETEVIKQKDGRETIVYYSIGNFRSGQNSGKTGVGGEAVFKAAHTFDGIRITGHEMKTCISYWRAALKEDQADPEE